MSSTIADKISVEWDEHGCELHVWISDDHPGPDANGLIVFNVHGIAEELYDAVKSGIGPCLQERYAAAREYRTGIADDPTQQSVLDRIKSRGDVD